MGDPGDSEVTSSSHSQVIIADVIVNPDHHHSGHPHTVDLDLWDLDLNSVYGDPTTTTTELNSPSSNINLLIANGTNNNANTLTTLQTQNNIPPGGGPTNGLHPNNNNNAMAAKRTVNRNNSLAVSSFSDSSSGREDLSPGGGFSADSCGEGKKKKGPVPRQQEELCLVCGDRASGYHYNALTCEGCKGFFRRSITKNAVYQCKYGNNCEIDMYMRRKCQECRLKKCLHVGMRPECVVPEYQCAVKREQKKQQKEKDKPNSTTQSPTPKADIDIKDERVSSMELSSNTNGIGGKNGVSPLKPIAGKKLSQEQEELINRLVFFQDEFEQPNDDDLKRLTGLPSEGVDASEAKFRHITEMTILTVQLIVEFSKRLPGFDKLEREDQITLLKACSSEVMMLRTARRYDYNSDTIIFANNHPYTRDNYSIAGVGDSAEPLFNFCRHLCSMKVDNAEYALLTAIVIFSERPCLLEPRKVEKIQEIYLEALRAYVEYLHPVRPGYVPGVNFAKLLGVLTELRTLGNINSEMCFSLKLKNKKLPPFLAEIWDIAA